LVVEATRPIGSEDLAPDLLGQRLVQPSKNLGLVAGSDPGPNPKQSQPLSPVAQSPQIAQKVPIAQDVLAPEELDAVQQISTKHMEETVGKLSDFVQSIQRSLEFSVDEESGRTVVKVMDTKTDEVIRQIPPEEVLRILRHMAASGEDGERSPQGFLVQEKA
jgi:flagellar protein FlaG